MFWYFFIGNQKTSDPQVIILAFTAGNHRRGRGGVFRQTLPQQFSERCIASLDIDLHDQVHF